MFSLLKKLVKSRVAQLCTLACILLVAGTILACNLLVATGEKFVFENPEDVPATQTALVLGTAPTTRGGGINIYFANRIAATKKLFDSGKIEHIIVSGDNRTHDYNEPLAMKNALVRLGVPAEKIYCDYAGLRTLDSVVRAREIFGQEKFVVVSQAFHCERAVFLARSRGIEAVGFVAVDNPPLRYKIKLWLRERLARVAAVADILFMRSPKHLGEPVMIK